MGDFTPFTAKELQPIVVDAVKTTLRRYNHVFLCIVGRH